MPDQTDFTSALLNPDMPVPEGIIRPDGILATKRFDVYRNNVVTSLIDALGTAFPVIKKLVGEKFFNAVAGVYVRAHPPSSPLIMFYGESFASFLEGFGPAQQLPYLPDVARMEHARRIAYHAADDEIVDPDALSAIAPDTLGKVRFGFHASARVISSPHPIFSIWRINSTDDQTSVVARAEDVLIARPQEDVEMRLLPPGGARFLTELQDGATLEEAASAATALTPEFDLSANLGGIFAARILSTITTE